MREGLSRRGFARFGATGALAELVFGQETDEAIAACKPPKKTCTKSTPCCIGTCKKGKCVKCANGATFLPGANPVCWLTCGGLGSLDRQFSFPNGVAVGGNGHAYVADRDNDRIQEFDLTLSVDNTDFFARRWGSAGGATGRFNTPNGVAVGSDGHVYVADTDNRRIQEFTSTGDSVRAWGSNGSGDGQFEFPLGVAEGGNGHVYVADTDNHRIVRMQVA